MVFGKIDYINLLPFHVFLKKSSLSSSFKSACEYHKSYPSAINKKFKNRRVDAAFISSIQSNKKGIYPLDIGIIAKQEVRSVLVKKGSSKQDPASATSNMLAQVLDIQGEVIIGDKALKLYLENPTDYVDLAQQWHQKHQLPFVFARLCVNRHKSFYKQLSKRFIQTPIKIPCYILEHYAKERGICTKDIQAYLKLISYTMKQKEAQALKLFLKKASAQK